MEKRWRVLKADEDSVQLLYESLKVSKNICRLLVQRGITSFDAAKKFFRPSLEHLHNPFLMKGMLEAVSRILPACKSGEKIMIYGDYDVDGTTAVAVMYMFLKNNFPKANLEYYVPHRYREGYGISKQGIDKAEELGCTLIIALDCGIRAVERIADANEKGIDVIVCDHHLPGEDLPKAFSILNPKQKDCSYPYKELSGCGIGFKLICGIAETEGLDMDTCYQYLDLVATSTAADIVPMNGENRILVYWGLQRANTAPGIALRKIKKVAQMQSVFTVRDLVFVVAPRINAAGRMDDARKAINFFVEENDDIANEKAEELNQDNLNRKEVERKISEEAFAMLREEDLKKKKKSTVLFSKDWHKGVVGIVASRMLEEVYRPTIILTESNGKITGSARSVKGLNIHDVLEECADLLENFGGHFFAAGMTLLPENLEAFKDRFEEVVAATITDDSLMPEIEIDAELNFMEITPSFYKLVQQFEPFGPENMRPVFVSRGIRDKNAWSKIVKADHLRLVVYQNNPSNSITGIGFNLADKFPVISSGRPFDVVYTVDENEYQGNVSLQLKVIDVKLSI